MRPATEYPFDGFGVVFRRPQYLRLDMAAKGRFLLRDAFAHSPHDVLTGPGSGDGSWARSRLRGIVILGPVLTRPVGQ